MNKKDQYKNIESMIQLKKETKYCAECKTDIPVGHFDDGTIIVYCPRCIGECLTCDCHLAQECFADAPSVKVIHPEKDIRLSDDH
jgi:hypothetical protein